MTPSPQTWKSARSLALALVLPSLAFGWIGIGTRGGSQTTSNSSGHGKITIDAYNSTSSFKTWLTGGNSSGVDLTSTLLKYVGEADVPEEKTWVAQLDDTYPAAGIDIIENDTNDSVQHCASAIRYNLIDDPRLWNARECLRLAIYLRDSNPSTAVRALGNGLHLLQDYFAHGNASCVPPDPHGIPTSIKVDTNGDGTLDTPAGDLCDNLLWDNHSRPADSTNMTDQVSNPYMVSWWHKVAAFNQSWRYQAAYDLSIEAMQCLAGGSVATFDNALARGTVINGPRTTSIDLVKRNAQFANLYPGPTAFHADFDGDGKADYAVWRPSTGTWYVKQSSNGASVSTPQGAAGDVPVPADYDGDGKTDRAVWRPETAEFIILNSSTNTTTTVVWGRTGDIPVVGDYDGDGKADYAIWRPENGLWYVKKASDGTWTSTEWGMQGDVPTPGDYDGDGKTDLSVWRESAGKWYVVRSSNGTNYSTVFGLAGDIPVPGDYDHDNKTDMSVWRPSTGRWYLIPSSTGTMTSTVWGQNGDVPVAGDFDGDGKTDRTVWRPSNGTWYLLKSSNGTNTSTVYGTNGDVVP